MKNNNKEVEQIILHGRPRPGREAKEPMKMEEEKALKARHWYSHFGK